MVELSGDGLGIGQGRNGGEINGGSNTTVGVNGGRVSFVDFRFVPLVDEEGEDGDERGVGMRDESYGVDGDESTESGE